MEGERVGVSLQLSVVLQPTVRVELRISAGGSDDGKPLPDPVDTKAAAKAARSLMQQGAKLTLLIVDDDPFERKGMPRHSSATTRRPARPRLNAC